MKRKKLIHEGQYLAEEVDVELVTSDDGWSLYLSVDAAYKLDDVREALKRETLRPQHGMAVSSH